MHTWFHVQLDQKNLERTLTFSESLLVTSEMWNYQQKDLNKSFRFQKKIQNLSVITSFSKRVFYVPSKKDYYEM